MAAVDPEIVRATATRYLSKPDTTIETLRVLVDIAAARRDNVASEITAPEASRSELMNQIAMLVAAVELIDRKADA